MEIFTMDQGSDEWMRARLGIPTASNFATVMAKGQGKTRRTYMQKLAGEIITGQPTENYANGYMERGHEMEDEARSLYAFQVGCDPETVGFIRNGQKGCSPDSIVGSNGLVEIKSKAPHILIDVYERDDIPPEHKAQCQGALWVAEREWIDFVAFYRGMPLFIQRAVRDEDYIANLSDEIDRFNDELAALVERVQAYGQPAKEAA